MYLPGKNWVCLSCLLFVLGLLICSRFRFGSLCFSDKRILFLLYISALHSCIHHWIFLVNFHICNSSYSNQLLVFFRSYLVLVRHVINGLQAPPQNPMTKLINQVHLSHQKNLFIQQTQQHVVPRPPTLGDDQDGPRSCPKWHGQRPLRLHRHQGWRGCCACESTVCGGS